MNNLDKAKEMLKDHSLALVKNEKVYLSDLKGVKPLLDFLKNNVDLEGFSLADKVIGKGVAFLILKAKIKNVYTKIISKPALDLLIKNGIEVYYDLLVENIINRTKTDLCPIEKVVLDVNDVDIAYQKIINKLIELGGN